MPVPSRSRRGRIAAAVFLVALSSFVFPVANVLAVGVGPATGVSAISADDFGTNNWTTLTGPIIQEQGPGELLTDSTTILNAPSHFRFNPAVGGVIVSPGCNMSQTVTITATQVTLKVLNASTVIACTLTFVALQVQPAIGYGLASNHIVKTGSSSAPGGGTSYGLLTKVAGAPKSLTWTTQPSATNAAGAAFATAPVLTVKDQFGNSVSKASVALSITPGTGPAGATLTCPTNPVIANSVGAATFTGCKIDMPGTYTLRAFTGAASAVSAPITVTGSPGNVGALPSVLAFTEGPGAPLGGKPFPTSVRVAIQNGGATRTSGISATVTLAIGNNPSGGVLTCTPDNTVGTIAGVATFTGCSIDKAGTGYTLTATASNVVPSGIIGTGTSGTFTVALPPPATGSPAPAPPPAPKSGTNGVTRTGNAKANVLVGTALADVLRGLGGNDRLSGNAGNDKLYGGPGRDILSGGAGADLLDAGTGNDTVNARDNVKDTIRCGPGKDTVTADKKDMVTRDCETVKRT